MIMHTKKLLTQSLKILFSAGIIYWLVSSGKLNFKGLKSLLAPEVALVGLALIGLNIFFASERWRVLIKSQNVNATSWPLMKLSLIGSFFNFAMPGGVGGDVIKAYYFTRQNPGSKVVAITSVLMDRVLGLYAMIVMALLSMLYDFKHFVNIPSLVALFWLIVGLFIAFSTGLSLVFSQILFKKKILVRIFNKLPFSSKLIELYESMHLYGNQSQRMLIVIILSLISQNSAILFLYLVGQNTGYLEIPLSTYFLIAPIGFMATAVPVSPAGVGVGQAAFYFLFNTYTGIKSDLGPTAMTAFQVGCFLVSLLGAFFYLRFKDKASLKISNIDQMDETGV